MDQLSSILVVTLIGVFGACGKLLYALAARQRAMGVAEIMRARAEILRAQAQRGDTAASRREITKGGKSRA